jgi:hypothetical protein
MRGESACTGRDGGCNAWPFYSVKERCTRLGFRDSQVGFLFQQHSPGCHQESSRHVQMKFPYLLTHRSAISLSIVISLTDDLLSGKTVKAINDSLHGRHTRKLHSSQLSYYSQVEYQQALPSSQITTYFPPVRGGATDLALRRERLENPLDFGRFDDPALYCGELYFECFCQTNSGKNR